MRILQVSSGSYTIGGGVSEYVRNISERLAKEHEVTVFATNPRGRLPRNDLINGVKVERFLCTAPYYFSWELPLRLRARTRKLKFDVVHGHNYHAFPLHFSFFARCNKFVISPIFHGAGHTVFRDCLIRLLKPFGKITLRKADGLLAASEYEQSLICQRFGIDPEEIMVIPRGVDFSEYKGLRRHKRGFKSILYVGRLLDYKGVSYLVEVLPRLKSDNVILEVVGKGPLKINLQNRAKVVGVFDKIRFYEDLDRHDLLQMYKDADLFVILSSYETYSKVVAEALVAGTPCVVANTSALTEWVDNECCFGVNTPLNVNKLAKLIDELLETRVNFEITKKTIGNKILDWDEVAKRLEDFYLN